MDRENPTNRSDPGDRNGAATTRAGNGLGATNGGAGNNRNGHGAVTGNGDAHAIGHGRAQDRLAPSHALTGASAVVRPVPGSEHKGMLKLVDFTQPANGTVSRNADQTLTFRPKPGFTGKDSFDYTLRDEAGTMFSATVTVAVTLDAPAVKPAPVKAPSLRALGSVPAPRPAPTRAPTPARAGEGLPRRHGGPGLFPSE